MSGEISFQEISSLETMGDKLNKWGAELPPNGCLKMQVAFLEDDYRVYETCYEYPWEFHGKVMLCKTLDNCFHDREMAIRKYTSYIEALTGLTKGDVLLHLRQISRQETNALQRWKMLNSASMPSGMSTFHRYLSTTGMRGESR